MNSHFSSSFLTYLTQSEHKMTLEEYNGKTSDAQAEEPNQNSKKLWNTIFIKIKTDS